MSRQVLESVAAALDVAADVVAGSGVVVGGTVVIGTDVTGFGVVVVDCLAVVVGSGVVGDCGVLVAASAAVADVTGTTVERADVSVLAVVRSSVVGAVDRREGEQKGPVNNNNKEDF